jgi:hypothetical protein
MPSTGKCVANLAADSEDNPRHGGRSDFKFLFLFLYNPGFCSARAPRTHALGYPLVIFSGDLRGHNICWFHRRLGLHLFGESAGGTDLACNGISHHAADNLFPSPS